MARINTRNYAWKDIDIRLNGKVLVSVENVNWNHKQEKEAIYGRGTKALGIKAGNESVDGALTLLQDELEQLLDIAPDGKAIYLSGMDIQVAFEDQGVIQRYTIVGVEFTEEPHEHNQNDKVARHALPFLALDSIRA